MRAFSADEKYMKKAIMQAKAAQRRDEVPIGCVIVGADGAVISRAFNLRETKQVATYHAEILAIERACRRLRSFRLDGATLYVTLEPCTMCAGAILNARIARVVFGASDNKGGYLNVSPTVFTDKRLNHSAEIVGGVLADECSALISDFFRRKRIDDRHGEVKKPR